MKARMVIHICGPEAEGETVIGGRTYRWDYHSYCGPTFLRKDGEPMVRQPGPAHPVWDAFQEWLDRRKS